MPQVGCWGHIRALLLAITGMLLITCGRPCPAAEVRLLETDRVAIETRLQLVNEATKTLDIAYFIIKDDCISRVFLNSLLAAARRGVCVRLIVDSMFNDMDPCMARQLIAAGVCIKEYHPLSITRPLTVSRRMHDKILIRDGVEMVVGSRNIEDAHFGISTVRNNFIDLDMHVTGPVIQHARAYYTCLWNSAELGKLQPDPCPAESGKCGAGDDSPKCPLRLCHREEEEPDPLAGCCCRYRSLTAGELSCRPEHESFSVPCVRFVHDPQGTKQREQGVRQSLYEILDNAKCSIVLQSPYVIPAGRLGRILRRAARRGVDIRILTNSLHTTDQILAYSAFTREAPECARAGIQFWEYGGPKCLHAKSFVVDGRMACVTSFNFDSRSAFLNTELATVICDEAFAAELLAAMNRNFCAGYRMRLEGLKLVSDPRLEAASPERTLQARTYGAVSTLNRVPGVSRVTEPSLRFLQGLSRFIQRQL